MQPIDLKTSRAIRLIQSAAADGQTVEVTYSGGKDSDVILALTRMAGIPFRAIYKNTTIDPPGTIRHCLDNGVEIRKPERSFFQLLEQKGFPNRFRRFCCEHLKEYKILDRCIVGVRREESVRRAKLYKEPSACRIYRNGGHVEQIYPILDWTLADLEAFITEHHIRLHSLYYDADGRLDLTQRLGCLGCPLASTKKRLDEFRRYPRLVRLYLRGGKTSFCNILRSMQPKSMPAFMSISPRRCFIRIANGVWDRASSAFPITRPSLKTISVSI